MVVRTEIGSGQLAELVKQVQAGNEVLLTQENRPVAKLVPAGEAKPEPNASLRIRSLAGHRVLMPIICQEEFAEDMFGKR